MGEELTLFRAAFNGSLRIESRPEHLTSEAGAVFLREVIERLGISGWMTRRLKDTRDRDLITHPLSELLNTSLLLLGQGWRDQDDADSLRNDAVFRLAVSERRGVAALARREAEEGRALSKNPPAPDGLASQPTLSRLVRMLSTEDNRGVLRGALLECAARRVRATRGHRHRYLTIDIDSLPIEVHGHQPGSEHNGHYHRRIYHPLIASIAETGDLIDAKLREGNAHTAAGSSEFIGELLDRVERKLCQVAAVRMDAGFPEENLLATHSRSGARRTWRGCATTRCSIAWRCPTSSARSGDPLPNPVPGPTRRPTGRRSGRANDEWCWWSSSGPTSSSCITSG